jgi:hypothetical protein
MLDVELDLSLILALLKAWHGSRMSCTKTARRHLKTYPGISNFEDLIVRFPVLCTKQLIRDYSIISDLELYSLNQVFSQIVYKSCSSEVHVRSRENRSLIPNLFLIDAGGAVRTEVRRGGRHNRGSHVSEHKAAFRVPHFLLTSSSQHLCLYPSLTQRILTLPHITHNGRPS